MWFWIDTKGKRTKRVPSAKRSEVAATEEAEIRRQMYERIAQGHALAEIEENARRRWHSK